MMLVIKNMLIEMWTSWLFSLNNSTVSYTYLFPCCINCRCCKMLLVFWHKGSFWSLLSFCQDPWTALKIHRQWDPQDFFLSFLLLWISRSLSVIRLFGLVRVVQNFHWHWKCTLYSSLHFMAKQKLVSFVCAHTPNLRKGSISLIKGENRAFKMLTFQLSSNVT